MKGGNKRQKQKAEVEGREQKTEDRGRGKGGERTKNSHQVIASKRLLYVATAVQSFAPNLERIANQLTLFRISYNLETRTINETSLFVRRSANRELSKNRQLPRELAQTGFHLWNNETFKKRPRSKGRAG